MAIKMQCCVALLVLLCGGLQVQAQGECLQKLGECSNIMTTAMNPITEIMTTMPIDTAALETSCSTVKQSLTTCVSDAKVACAGQDSLIASLDQLLASVDQVCGAAVVCQLKATSCQAPLLAVLPTGPPSANETSDPSSGLEFLSKTCPLYTEVVTCLTALSATEECAGNEAVANMTEAISSAQAGCAAIGGGGGGSGGSGTNCLQALTCMSAFGQGSGDGPQGGQCSQMLAVTRCVASLKDTCSLDESKMTFSKVESVLMSVCAEIDKFPAEYQNCSALGACVVSDQSLGLSEMQSMGEGETSPNLDSLKTFLDKFLDPAFFCNYMKVGVQCSISSAQQCQYSPDYVTSMTSQAEVLKSQCAQAVTGDGSGGGAERSSGHVTLLLLATLWTFLIAV